MVNAAYYDKPLILIGATFRENLVSSGSEYKLLNTFEFIKVVSDTILDMKNAAYHTKPLILMSHRQAVNINCWIRLSLSRLFLTLYLTWKMLFIMTSLWYLSGYKFELIKAVFDTVFDMINAAYYTKPLISISHRRAVNINCWIHLSLSRLFLTLYLTW